MIPIPYLPKVLFGFKFKVARDFYNIYLEQQKLPKLTQKMVAEIINGGKYLTQNFSTADLSEAENGKVYNFHVPALIAYFKDIGIDTSFFLNENIYTDIEEDVHYLNLPISEEIYQKLDVRTFFKEIYRVAIEDMHLHEFEIKIKIMPSPALTTF
jgi:hypothetical protein